ncbi:MAG: hypothetical protein KJ838_03765 [Candidatus Omnitrophica bacterium]|nr:hypothetical protein [Candidatus Omnitrophota bacterium]
MKTMFIVIAAVLIGLGLLAFNVYAHHGYQGYYGYQGQGCFNDEEIQVDAQKIEKGVQLTITSEDAQVVKYLQEDSRWFGQNEKYSGNCGGYGYGPGR